MTREKVQCTNKFDFRSFDPDIPCISQIGYNILTFLKESHLDLVVVLEVVLEKAVSV